LPIDSRYRELEGKVLKKPMKKKTQSISVDQLLSGEDQALLEMLRRPK